MDDSVMTWDARIQRALENNGFTEDDQHLAVDWMNCACSGLDPRIPRNSDGMPMDITLRVLGSDFNWAVGTNLVKKAAQVKYAIDKHAKYLMSMIEPRYESLANGFIDIYEADANSIDWTDEKLELELTLYIAECKMKPEEEAGLRYHIDGALAKAYDWGE